MRLQSARAFLRECNEPSALASQSEVSVIRDVPGVKTLLSIDLGRASCFVKIYWRNGFVKRAKDLLYANRLACRFLGAGPVACRESKNLLRMKSWGMDTPTVVDFGDISYDALTSHSYLVLEDLRPCETVWKYLKHNFDADLLCEIAEKLWTIHRHGYVHGDAHSKNILLVTKDERKQIHFIDVVGMHKSTCTNKRISELVRFLVKHKRVWLDDEAVAIFLDAYYRSCGGQQGIGLEYQDYRDRLRNELLRFAPWGGKSN